MKHIVLGTAGHVDHGKTSLVKALTGIDTDRLKEEKERGITIELGFASLPLADGRIVGLVDVPGHERFIKNMVAGAGGIDMVLLVIAADEGVMPQTREHLHICSLLGTKRGLVALTKIDMVDASWLELVTDDIHEFLKGTFLESSPVIPVSVVTGEGVEEVRQGIEEIALGLEEEGDSGIFRLPVDRVFTMRGFGTVVTGTVISGKIGLGDEVAVLPGKLVTKARGIQVHNRQMEIAEAGQRTAVNLQGVEKMMIERGNVLAHPATLEPSLRLDVVLQYLAGAGRKLKNRSLVRLHVGTSEIISRVVLMDSDELEPGARAYAQFLLESPSVVMARDRFVIRSYSPMTTVGGGIILDPLAVKHKRHADRVLHDFSLLEAGGSEERTAVVIARSGQEGINLGQLIMKTGLPRTRLQKILEGLITHGKAALLDREETRVVDFAVFNAVQNRILELTRTYHKKFPLKEGIHKEELKTTVGRLVSAKLFALAARELEKNGALVVDKETVRLSGHSVNLKGELDELRAEIARLYREAGLMPPTVKELMARYADRNSQLEGVIKVMLKEGTIVKVSEDLYFHKDVLQKLREDYRKVLIRDGKGTPANFRELTGLSRKFIIPLMEYFDMTKLTIRAGEQRILRDNAPL